MTWDAAPTGRRGRHQTYSDAAIQRCLFNEGLARYGAPANDWFRREPAGVGQLGLSGARLQHTVSSVARQANGPFAERGQKTLAVNTPYRGSKGPLHLRIDSTGIKVEGEGEWNARKHGGPKRRV